MRRRKLRYARRSAEIFAIAWHVQIFNDFAASSAKLVSRLTSGDKIIGLQATSGFDASTNILTSQRVLVEFKSKN